MVDSFNAFNDQNQQKSLLETTRLSRAWQHLQGKEPLAMISLSRSGMTHKEKIYAFRYLRDVVRLMGYGYIELKGGYVEKGDEDMPDFKVDDELSLMIPKMTREDAIKLGQIDLGHGPQDSVLYYDGKSFLGYLNTNSKLGPLGQVEMKFTPHEFSSAVDKYFSTLAKGSHSGRKFTFLPESIENRELRVWEMRDRRHPSKKFNGDWWSEFGFRIL